MSSGGATASAVGIGSQIIQIGSGNSSNLRRRLENLERASKEAANAKANAKKANAAANARPSNANAAKANANAARRELEAMRKELEALTAAKAAAEAEKLNLQSKLEKAQETGANVNSLRQAYTKAQNAAVKMEANFKAKLTEATEEAQQARANANAAKENAKAKQARAESAEATAADHLAAKQASNRAASEASNAARAALAEKAALNTQYALAEIRIKAVTENKNASAAERNAARANAAAARARTAQANARARAAESARLSATAEATAAMRKASENRQVIERQLANATRQAERNAANIARLTAQGATKAQVNAARANAARRAAEANRLRRQLASVSTGKVVNAAKGVVYGVGGVLAAGLRGGLNALSRAPVQATVSLQRGNGSNNGRRQDPYSSSNLVRNEPSHETNKRFGKNPIGPPIVARTQNTRQSSMYSRVVENWHVNEAARQKRNANFRRRYQNILRRPNNNAAYKRTLLLALKGNILKAPNSNQKQAILENVEQLFTKIAFGQK